MQTETINDIFECLQCNDSMDDSFRKKLCYQLIELAISQNNEYAQAYGLYNLGSINYRQRRYKQSLDYLLKCREFIKEDTEPSFHIKLILLIGMLMTKLGNEQRAVDYFAEAQSLARENQFYDQEAIVYCCQASVYARLLAYEEAFAYYEKEYQCRMQHKDEVSQKEFNQSMCYLYLNCGMICCQKKQYDKAFSILHDVETYGAHHAEDVELLYYIFKIRLYTAAKRMDECMTDIQLLFQKASELPDILDVYEEFMTLFDVFMQQGYSKEAYRVVAIMEKTAMTVQSDNCQLKYAEVQTIYHQRYGSKEEFRTWFEKFLYYGKKDEYELAQIKLINLKEKQLIHSTESQKKLMQHDMFVFKEKSEHDALTGLANRYYLNDYFEACCKEAVSRQVTLGVDIIDIDYFKKYNDFYGHLEGDQCLALVADAMKEAAGEHFLSRYGGDEFIIVFLDASTQEVYRIAQQIKTSVSERKIQHAKEAACEYITVSQGLVNEIPKAGQTISDFIHSADTALYRGKVKERNTVCIGTL